MDEAADFFRQMIQYRHQDGGVIFEVLQPSGIEEYEPGKIRTITKVVGCMRMGPDTADEIADEIKLCARRARENPRSLKADDGGSTDG